MSKKTVRITFFSLLLTLCFPACQKDDEESHSKPEWMRDYFAEVTSGNYPGIYAVSWWNENFDETCLKINSSWESLETYRELVSDSVFITSCMFSGQKLVPVTGKIYHSAFPDFGGTEDIVTGDSITGFENLCRKGIALAYFSNNWLDSLVFPGNSVDIIRSTGKTPFIRLMFRSVFEESGADPVYSLIDVVNGRYDAAVLAWANEAKSCGTNLLAEFGTEVNGFWFPWNGSYCGGGTTDGYGDSTYPDGPEIFRDACRRIIDLCNQQGAANITWFFHFDVNNDPDVWWNDPVYYYPGDAYIDWIGVSTYGSFMPDEDYVEPRDMIIKAYDKLQEVSGNKPYAILEFGVTEL